MKYEKYPGEASSNLDFYKQYDKNLVEKTKEFYETIPSIKNVIIWWKLKTLWKFRFRLKSISDVYPNKELIKVLSSEWFDISKPFKVSKLTFINDKLYAGKNIFLVYKLESWKLKLYGAIDSQNDFVEINKEYNLDSKHIIWQQIAKIINCNDCKVLVKNNEIFIFKETRKTKWKTWEKWIFKFSFNYWEKVERKVLLKVILWWNWWLIKNASWWIVWRLEKYGNDIVVLDTRWRVVKNFQTSNIIDLNIPQFSSKILLKVKDF